ncbi:MAG TPA: hypothetical protein VMY06_14575 [Sedimentisphaerales bacterium]|nr:hypothetical protein [Sedimentisphaerales bacterium]HUU15554.1 hypothetical protein [Sedimentisphaerales bacterium]
MRHNFTYESDLILKDAGAIAASAAALVGGVAKRLDVGAGVIDCELIIDIASIDVDGSAAQGTLTLDTNCTGGNSSQGLLTLDVNPVDANNDTMTIGTTVYRFKDVPIQVEDILIGATAAATQLNILATINGTGTEGTEYFAGSTSPHPLVRMGAFAADDSIVTAIATGVAGDLIATTETFTAVTNIFNAGTLGTTAAGADGDTMTIDTKVYYFDINGALDNIDGHIEVGTLVADTQASIIEAFVLGGVPGTGYAANMTAHPTVDIAAFASDDAILTAKTPGVASDAIATTETFAAGTNVFDATTLGAVRAGADGDERYDILLQGSNSATFASVYTDIAAVAVGAAAAINGDVVTPVGRISMPFRNEFMGTVYQYLRLWTVVAGTHVGTGINYQGRICKG